jgi:hypothetical protein
LGDDQGELSKGTVGPTARRESQSRHKTRLLPVEAVPV